MSRWCPRPPIDSTTNMESHKWGMGLHFFFTCTLMDQLPQHEWDQYQVVLWFFVVLCTLMLGDLVIHIVYCKQFHLTIITPHPPIIIRGVAVVSWPPMHTVIIIIMIISFMVLWGAVHNPATQEKQLLVAVYLCSHPVSPGMKYVWHVFRDMYGNHLMYFQSITLCTSCHTRVRMH